MSTPLLIQTLRNPTHALAYSIEQWELLIRQARSANLLPRLYCIFNNASLLAQLPEDVVNHLESGYKKAQRQHQQVIWEIHQIQKAFTNTEITPILLKGGAYIHSGVTCAQGRTLSDIDILVRKADLKKAEMLLMIGGWITTKSDDYDKMYYREWTHEIPPIRHIKRGTVIDVHHNIFPILNFRVDAEKLWKNALIGQDGIGVLSLEDMILHSATHLFLEGNFENGLRDLTDLDLLFKMLDSQQQGFEKLKLRAFELGLGLPLFYALRYCQRQLNSMVPSELIHPNDVGIPSAIRLKLMDILFSNVLIPFHATSKSPLHGIAVFFLYWRGHFNRMPLKILIPHLIKKSLKSLTQRKESKELTQKPQQ
ncbi:MAG: nucleotidyltransferase family protein [Hahellaceae bacterium]|nr:nucleotidyltransferase family protein [Hahellaceae bacterium]